MATTVPGHQTILAPGALLEERNGWKLYAERDVHDVTRGGKKQTRLARYVVVSPEGKETYYGDGRQDREAARYWFDAWSAA